MTFKANWEPYTHYIPKIGKYFFYRKIKDFLSVYRILIYDKKI